MKKQTGTSQIILYLKANIKAKIKEQKKKILRKWTPAKTLGLGDSASECLLCIFQ